MTSEDRDTGLIKELSQMGNSSKPAMKHPLPDFSKMAAESAKRAEETDRRILASGLMTEEELKAERLKAIEDPCYVLEE